MASNTLRPYADWAPTSFDRSGAFLPDRQHWLVMPVSQTRDSDTLSESNFAAALTALGGESDTVEVHRFGHWGPGWVEIIIMDPADAARVAVAEELVGRLENYPVLNEDDWSRREYDRAYEWWMACGRRERIRVCAKYRVSIFAARRDEIPEDVDVSYLAE